MNQHTYFDFISAINAVQFHLRNNGVHLETGSWQGIQKPIEFFEALNVSFTTMINPDMIKLQQQIKPNLPWAEDHFYERIGGKPLNPGEQYKNWPYYKNNPSNDKFRTTDGEKFSHTYMERFWPMHAGKVTDGFIKTVNPELGPSVNMNRGIRFDYGDLNTMMEVMKKDPYTRQAYLPIWFPEDGAASYMGERVPCTLGYHFIRRGHQLHMTYYIRSCDFIRHFRDDIYLACRLLLFILQTLKSNDFPAWGSVQPGVLTMHIVSLHIFSKEYNLLKD